MISESILPPILTKSQLHPYESTQVSVRSYNKSAHSKLQQLKTNSYKSFLTESREIEDKRWPTEAETNDFYEQDFQDQSSLYQKEEIVPEQIQPQITAKSWQKCKSFDICLMNNQHDSDWLQNASIADLNKKNQQLIDKIQMLKKMISVYKRNDQIISQQTEELNKLRRSKTKALNISYQLSLDREKFIKSNASTSTSHAIKHLSAILNKDKFKFIKQSQNLAYPSEFQLSKSQVSCIRQSSPSIARLVALREDLLNKRRMQELNKRELIRLSEKEHQYKSAIKKCETFINRVSHSHFKKQTEMLINQNEHNNQQYEMSEICLNLQINDLRNNIWQIQSRILQIDSKKKHCQIQMPQTAQQYIVNPCLSPTKLSKPIKTNEIDLINKQIDKRKVKKFNYNSLKSRNYQFFRETQNKTQHF